jgi:hypothetical protein
MGKPNVKEKVNSGEEYVRGRKSGVEGTYGEKHDGVAEKTLFPGLDSNDGGGEDGLKMAASSIYSKAVKNEGDSIGDKALTER